MNDYQKEQNKKRQELLKTVKSFTNEAVKLEGGDSMAVKITKDFPIYIRGKNFNNQYTFSLWHKLKYITHSDRNRVEEKYQKPNNIGVMNAKKLEAWVKYLKLIYLDLCQLSKDKQNKVDTFMTKVKKIKDLKLGGYNLSEGEFRGTLVKGGLDYSFEINRSGYINEKIEVHYATDKTLENFLKLADNKL